MGIGTFVALRGENTDRDAATFDNPCYPDRAALGVMLVERQVRGAPKCIRGPRPPKYGLLRLGSGVEIGPKLAISYSRLPKRASTVRKRRSLQSVKN